MDGFVLKLKNYGADVEGTLERFLGDVDLYKKCLDDFLEDQTMCKLKEAVEAGDTHTAFLHSHALKGVAGNLGLTPLYERLIEEVEPLRTENAEDMMRLYLEVEKEYERLRQEVL
ncbi:Hpt domain-containing protein [Eubacterium oxidoreducens]|uniref:HPt (Histidine-containing phosphotransfer) domain-containing protein n=1 Tax=Eubacterium oxidoreducens TaxID=1732 RepID=A0A1G6C1G9_EUBOX|nr:Hpt domain-containing protein [Eubacterium oxidoreducens]SDB26712.1 HPt (histidine-containing phosphotransfer) domain-containing protein [Eubacterium oxidoreducens]